MPSFDRSVRPRFRILVFEGVNQIISHAEDDAICARQRFEFAVDRYEQFGVNRRVELYDRHSLIETWARKQV